MLKKKAEVGLTLVSKCCTIDEQLDALCGISRHTASSENYFMDSTYHKVFLESTHYKTLQESLIMNMEGQVVNVLPLITAQAKKSWSCSFACKTDNPVLIERYQQFLETVNTCTLKNIPTLVEKIHKCTIKTSDLKLGHAQSCYSDLTLCKAMLIPVLLLSPHFPKVRDIKRLIYKLMHVYQKMLKLDEALNCADLDMCNKIVTEAQEKADIYKRNQTDAIVSDGDIFSKYKNAFKILKKRVMDTPHHACISCERLCYKRSVSEVNKIIKINNPVWKDLIEYVKKQEIAEQYICNYCKEKFRKGLMPAYCILNNLFASNVPEVISSLNAFEKILIQRAKAFQTVVKMGTVMNRKVPERHMIQKVKGRTFHLPLPIQETLNKLSSETDAININHELYIVVRGIPTKSKIIWEEIVNIKKIFDALMWLKNNNPLYSKIILPNTPDELDLKELNSLEFQEQENENVKENILDEQYKDVEHVVPDQPQALLTQVTDNKKNDNYYEQYTIYPLYEKKSNKTATALYQMVKVQELPLDNREKCLNLLCFPDLYPFGINGEHEQTGQSSSS